jgi:hypothetical protein
MQFFQPKTGIIFQDQRGKANCFRRFISRSGKSALFLVGTARCAVRAAYQRRNVGHDNASGMIRSARGDIAARCPYRDCK